MIERRKSREMSGQEPNSKNKGENFKAGSKKIRCLRECHMPGVGSFQTGELIEDKEKIALINDNPNFEYVNTEV